MTTAPAAESLHPLRVLFLCTGNSARSQMAEAVLNHRGMGRFFAESAGSRPAARVNPYAIATLRNAGIPWAGHAPRAIDGLERERWDIVITVCDRAKEACPYLPGQPIIAHWGMEDPAEVEGSDDTKARAFGLALVTLARRIDLLLALPIDAVQRSVLEGRVRAIGTELAGTDPVACTLGLAAYGDRVAWILELNRVFLRSHERRDSALELVYRPDAAALVRELVQREQTCCAFLRFTLREAADAVRLRIDAPAGARDDVDGFFAPFLAGITSATGG